MVVVYVWCAWIAYLLILLFGVLCVSDTCCSLFGIWRVDLGFSLGIILVVCGFTF